jgi:Domain of unknown function (DUF4845)
MTHQSLQSQRGLGIISLLFWVVLIGAVLIVAMKTVPLVTEYLTIKKTIALVANAGDPAAIRSAFDKQMLVNESNKFTSRDLVIESTNGGSLVSFEYQRTVHLAGPVSLLFDFNGKELNR